MVREPYRPSEEHDLWVATLSDPDDNYWQLISPFDPGQM